MPLQIEESPKPSASAPAKHGRRSLLAALLLVLLPILLVVGGLVLSIFRPYIVELGWGSFGGYLMPAYSGLRTGWQPTSNSTYEGVMIIVPAGPQVWVGGILCAKPGKRGPVRVRFLK